MKARILILTIAILGAGLLHANEPVQKDKTECIKQMHKTIKRTLSKVSFKRHVDEGQKCTLKLTCVVNEDNVLEINKIDGADDAFKSEIINTMKKYKVKCDFESVGRIVNFSVTYDHRPFS